MVYYVRPRGENPSENASEKVFQKTLKKVLTNEVRSDILVKLTSREDGNGSLKIEQRRN